MKPHPRVKLSRLRDIGWSLWDPIGLMPKGMFWHHEDHLCFADEYDRYLIQAASQLRRGISDVEVVGYLVSIEINYMGLGEAKNTQERAEKVVAAIKAEDNLWTHPDERGRFND